MEAPLSPEGRGGKAKVVFYSTSYLPTVNLHLILYNS